MIRYLTIAIVFALLIPTQRAAAQNNTVGGALLGGAAGTIIDGAATGRVGGAVAGGIIGAAAGARLATGAAATRVLLVRRPLLDSLRR
jgi:outer membrane lipoprotein SlyB